MVQSLSMPTLSGAPGQRPPRASRRSVASGVPIAECLGQRTPSHSSDSMPSPSMKLKMKRRSLVPLPPLASDPIVSSSMTREGKPKEGKSKEGKRPSKSRHSQPPQRVEVDAGGLNGADWDGVSVVIQRLKDSNHNVRCAAVRALGKVAENGNSEALTALTNGLKDEDRDVRQAAEEVLTKIVQNATDEEGNVGVTFDLAAEKLNELHQQRQAPRMSEIRSVAKANGYQYRVPAFKNIDSVAGFLDLDTDSRLLRMQQRDIPNCNDPLAQTTEVVDVFPPGNQQNMMDLYEARQISRSADEAILALDKAPSIEDADDACSDKSADSLDFDIDELVQTLPDPNPKIGKLALKAVGLLSDWSAETDLASATPSVKFDVLEVLIKLSLRGVTQAVETIERWRVSDPDPSVRLKAGYALGQVTARSRTIEVKSQAADAVARSKRASMVVGHTISTSDGEVFEMVINSRNLKRASI